MKNYVEGLLLCLGVGLFYLAADANDNGRINWALWLFVLGACFLVLFLFVSSTPTVKSDLRRKR
jgi:hypothetical protein